MLVVLVFVLFYCCCFLSSCLFVVDFVQHFSMSSLKLINQLAISHSLSVNAQHHTYLHKCTSRRTTSYIKRFFLFVFFKQIAYNKLMTSHSYIEMSLKLTGLL